MNIRDIKRLAIFVIYDKEGVIDDYILFYLKELCPNITHLVIVCNGKLTVKGREKLERFTDEIYVRPNIGFDCGAIKDVLYNFVGWNKVYEYDELLIANDTVYGPLHSFAKVFGEMDEKDVDFWGLTVQAETNDLTYLNIRHAVPKYIQSHFINVKKRLLHSGSFRDFWCELDIDNLTFIDAIRKYEVEFTNYFSNEGFTYSSYTDTAGYFSAIPDENYIATHVAPLDMLKICGAPCIKKKAFTYARSIKLKYKVDTKPNEIMDYIENETDYDINLIWDNLLRISPAKEITDNLKLHFLVQKEINAEEIEQLFLEHPRLGVLVTPQLYNSVFFEKFAYDYEHHGQYWYKDEVISGDNNFELMELPEIARKRGYYTGTVQSVESAAVRNSDLEYMLKKILSYLPRASTFFDLLNIMRLNDIRRFCQDHTRVYLYGAGGEAERWAEALEQEKIIFDGFVVSDGQRKNSELKGRPIMFLSEIISEKDTCGLILALNPNNSNVVLALLKEKQFKDILVLN